MDSNNPHWGWSWLERWMASRPWEELKPEKEANMDAVVRGKGRPPSRLNSRTLSTGSGRGRKLRSESMKGNNEDSQSMRSAESEQHCHRRRHSIAGSSSSSLLRDDESLASCSTSVPGYMTPTKSTKAKSRFSCSVITSENNGTPERRRSIANLAKKRLSFPGSPCTSTSSSRRHSVPPKLEIQ